MADQRRDNVVDAPQLFRRDGDPLTAFATCNFVLFLGGLGVIQATAKRTAVPLFTAIADIGYLQVLRTEFLLEVFADLVAGNVAFGAVLRPFILTDRTDIPVVLTDVSVKAWLAAAAAILDDEMVSDFLRNCGRIFSEVL